jgi:hypothetical protein
VIDNTPVVSDASDLEYDENEPMQIDESDDDDGSEFEVDSNTEDEETMRPAGRRLALMNAEVEFEFEALSDSSVQSASSEEIPLASSSRSKSKSKAGPKATKKVAPIPEVLKNVMTMSELRATQKEKRKALLLARRANKKAEMALSMKLGRGLTHASFLPHLIFTNF